MMDKLVVCSLLVCLTSCLSFDVEKPDRSGNTLLMQAIKKGDLLNIKKLTQSGADVNTINKYGMTPLRLAILGEQPEVIDILVKHNAHSNIKNPHFLNKQIPLNVLKMPSKEKVFYLTFDLGRDNGNLAYILWVLKKYNVQATFFLTDFFIKRYPIDTLALAQSGHAIANHTYTHFRHYYGKNHIVHELRETEKIYKETTGKAMLKIWRAPGLIHIVYPSMLQHAKEIGYQHVDASLYTKDYVGKWNNQYISNDNFLKLFMHNLDFRKYSRAALEPSLLRFYARTEGTYNGVILLMHGEKFRGDADFIYTLEPLIVHLVKLGYRFGTCDLFLNK